MIAVIDYDAGNLKSVEKALLSLGEEVLVTRDRQELLHADKVILPGVGHFGDAMEKLRSFGLVDVVKEIAQSGKPFLGTPGVEGLGILKGEILRIPDDRGLKVPHIGWNSLKLQNQGRLFRGLEEEPYVYFVHSYYLKAAEPQIVKAVTEYGVRIDASVEQGNVFACQFHPEKSSRTGLAILNNFSKLEG